MPLRLALSLACVLSGAAALVYQVLWSRQLSLVLGTSTEAVAVVLSSFMAGLGLGNSLAARAVLAGGPPRPLSRGSADARSLVRLYVALEAAIALGALVLPLAFAHAAPLLAPLYDGPAASPLAFRLARLALSFGLLVVPTTAMGATLPVLVALARSPPGHEAATAGALYAWNAVGAVVGALATPLLALPLLGMTRSLLVAAAGNVLAALVVLAAGRRASPSAEEPPVATGPGSALPRSVLLVTFLSGAGALAHEVAWTRAMVLLVGPTAYAFAFVLASVIAGLAVGSALMARFADRLPSPALVLALLQAGVAACALAVVPAVGALPVTLGEWARARGDAPSALLLGQAVGTLGVLLLPSALFGATFPLCVRLLAAAGVSPGAATARLLTWNTLGAVLGPLVAGFLLLPILGLEATLKAAALVHTAAALVALAAARPVRAVTWGAAIVAPAVGLLLLPGWDLELLAGGAYRYAHREDPAALLERLRAGELLYYRDGALATVSVKRLGTAKALAVDGKVDATNTGDMAMQKLLAHLPLLLHGQAREALIVGLGSGGTAAAALAHPLVGLEVVEISPEVVEAARLHFADVQQGALSDPRLRLRVTDARNHLLLSSRRYDVILSEPSNPWMAGVSSLFTRDFFALARSRLRPGGLLGQWMHVYGMPVEQLKTVVGSFADVFPDSALFQISEGDLLLLGAAGPWPEPPAEEMTRRLTVQAVAADLRTLGVTEPATLALTFVLGPGRLRAFAAHAPRHTDDRPILDLAAARAMIQNTAGVNRQALLAAAEGAIPPEPWRTLLLSAGAPALVERGRMLERSTGLSLALEAHGRALRLDPRSAAAQEGLVRIALASEARVLVENLLRHLAAGPDRLGARVSLARLYRGEGRLEDAGRELGAVLLADPSNLRALKLLATIQGDLGQAGAVEFLAGRALALQPGDGEAAALLASASLLFGDATAALDRADIALALHPGLELARRVRALALARLRRNDEARAAFALLCESESESASWRSFLYQGAFLADLSDWTAARRAFETAVDLAPESDEAWAALQKAAEAQGDRARAADARGVRRRFLTPAGENPK